MWVPVDYNHLSVLLGALSWCVAVFSSGFAAIAASANAKTQRVSLVCLFFTLLVLPASYYVLLRRGTCGADGEPLDYTNCEPDTLWP